MIQCANGCWIHFVCNGLGGLPESVAKKLTNFRCFRCLTAAEANSQTDAAIQTDDAVHADAEPTASEAGSVAESFVSCPETPTAQPDLTVVPSDLPTYVVASAGESPDEPDSGFRAVTRKGEGVRPSRPLRLTRESVEGKSTVIIGDSQTIRASAKRFDSSGRTLISSTRGARMGDMFPSGAFHPDVDNVVLALGGNSVRQVDLGHISADEMMRQTSELVKATGNVFPNAKVHVLEPLNRPDTDQEIVAGVSNKLNGLAKKLHFKIVRCPAIKKKHFHADRVHLHKGGLWKLLDGVRGHLRRFGITRARQPPLPPQRAAAPAAVSPLQVAATVPQQHFAGHQRSYLEVAAGVRPPVARLPAVEPPSPPPPAPSTLPGNQQTTSPFKAALVQMSEMLATMKMMLVAQQQGVLPRV